MSESFLGPKPVRSVAAFLWMPQLRLSFRQMSHLAPVFIRTLASAFVATNLLPRNHPALMYGVEGVRKYSAGQLIGEAWFTLRTTRASVNQWGIFISVMLMIAMVIGAAVSFLMTVAFGLGTSAQAQLFSHPRGDSSFGADGAYPATATTDPFDKAIPSADTPAGDYGIMMLDKAIRAGAHGQGGLLQQATQDLMLVYNSGILVIASVIIFWMIVSIVVDTAKTGQVGGGRHNMVWLPIRIVFALALLIPLGSTGYSSGQFMVMKLAEWGSNFGTRAWTAYVGGVSDRMSFVSSGQAVDVRDAVTNYGQMWLCRMAVNTNMSNSGSGEIDDYVVEKVTSLREGGALVGAIGGGAIGGATGAVIGGTIGSVTSLEVARTVSFEQGSSKDLCGSMTYPLNAAAPYGTAGIDLAIYNFKNTMALAYYEELIRLQPLIVAEMCKWVGMQPHRSGKVLMSEAKENLGSDYARTVSGWESCADSVGNPALKPQPTLAGRATLQGIMDRYQTAVTAKYRDAFTTYARAQRELKSEMTERGWAGMGTFYQRIAQMNAVAYEARRPSSVIKVGSMQDLKGATEKPGWLARLFGSENTTWITDTNNVINDFSNWWNATPDGASVDISTNDSADGKSVTIAAMRRDPVGALVGQLGLGGTSMVQILANEDPALSPLATVSSVGNYLFWVPIAALSSLTIVQVLIATLGGYVTGGAISTALVNVVNAITSLLMLPMAAGAMLKFYLPLIPFIRVTLSILTWIISVFEAVVMVPIAALAHLSSQGEGLATGAAESAWKLWLNILLRPILTVIGFVGAIMVFNAFTAYVNAVFADMYKVQFGGHTGLDALVEWVVLGLLYMFIVYTVANTVFKMLDLIPDALSRWYGVPRDQSFDGINEGAFIMAASRMVQPPKGKLTPPKDKRNKGDQGSNQGQAGMNQGGGDS